MIGSITVYSKVGGEVSRQIIDNALIMRASSGERYDSGIQSCYTLNIRVFAKPNINIGDKLVEGVCEEDEPIGRVYTICFISDNYIGINPHIRILAKG